MSENNRRQAYIPEGAQPIENPVGTAPAFLVEHGDKAIISLPGVPREMMYLLDRVVLPYLASKFDLRDVILVRTLHTVGEGESRIDESIHDLEQSVNPAIGLSAKSGQVDVRITARATGREAALAAIAEMEAKVRERLGGLIFGADSDTLEGVIAALMVDRRQSLSTAELNTGGMISSRLTLREVAGLAAKDVFRGGLVLSDAGALSKALEVDVTPAESAAVIARAAQRVRKIHATTLGLAAMLADSPDGVGMKMYVALVSDAGEETLERSYGGHSGLAPQWTSSLALGMLWKFLKRS
jgi:nicotinamide mononucleotide (NMN) deamidase PncC